MRSASHLGGHDFQEAVSRPAARAVCLAGPDQLRHRVVDDPSGHRDRVFIGSSIGYYKLNIIETFEDRDLALKECENIRRNNSQSYAHVVSVES